MQAQKTINTYVYLAIYCFIFLCYGLLSGSLGPVIPYLANQREVSETQYSFLFITRMVGSLCGFALYKFLQLKQIKGIQHKMIAFGGLVCFAFMILFVEWKTNIGAGISMAIFGMAQYGAMTATNICTLLISQHKAEKWIILINGSFSIGALISPQIIRIHQTSTYYIVSVFFIAFSALCLFFKTPTLYEQELKLKDLATTHKPFKNASLQLVVLIGTGLFLIAGIQSVVTSWVPTYSVQSEVFTKEEATIYGTLFWGMSTILRFTTAFMTTKSSIKLKILLAGIFISGIVCFGFDYFQSFHQAALFGAIAYGLSCSAVYPLIFSITTEFNIKFKPEQITLMLVGPIFSSGLNTGITGLLMRINVSFLFLSLEVLSVSLWITSMLFFRVMQKSSQPEVQSLQLLQQQMALEQK